MGTKKIDGQCRGQPLLLGEYLSLAIEKRSYNGRNNMLLWTEGWRGRKRKEKEETEGGPPFFQG